MDKYVMHAKFTAAPGARETLAGLLLEAAAAMETVPGNELYLVHVSETGPDDIWVYEVWSSEDAHAASLQDEATKAAIRQAMPLIAGVEPVRVKLLGGHGLPAE